jgi:hypothetical protein
MAAPMMSAVIGTGCPKRMMTVMSGWAIEFMAAA